MDEDQLFLRPAKPPPAGISEDLYGTMETYDLVTARFTPKQRVWQAAILGIIGGYSRRDADRGVCAGMQLNRPPCSPP